MNTVPGNYPPGLNAVLYSLYYILDIKNDDEYSKIEKELKSNYSKDVLNSYLKAINWVFENKEIDLTNRLPNLKRNNSEILYFLGRVSSILENIMIKQPH
jgi:hypothetical protein